MAPKRPKDGCGCPVALVVGEIHIADTVRSQVTMIASRVTLAMMEAAAMCALLCVAFDNSRLRKWGREEYRNPSTSTCRGSTTRQARAWRMATKLACRMLRRSISAGFDDTHANRHSNALDHAHTTLLAARPDNFLLSLRRGSLQFSGRMTAAATTGPASGPRPTSSTPAIQPYIEQDKIGRI